MKFKRGYSWYLLINFNHVPYNMVEKYRKNLCRIERFPYLSPYNCRK